MRMPKRITLVSPGDPRDMHQWSGTTYSLYNSLIQQVQQSDYTFGSMTANPADFLARIVNRMLRIIGISIDCRFSTFYAVLCGAVLRLKLLFVRDTLLVAVAASNCVAYLRTRHPMVYISDCTFSSISDFYPGFRRFPTWLKRQGDKNERQTLSRCRFVIYPSCWAMQSAQRDYAVPVEHIRMIPFGPNIPPALIETWRTDKMVQTDGELRILFVSADWRRKNGPLVLEVANALIDNGLKVTLIMVGDIPEHVQTLQFVDARGFLRKSDPKHMIELCQIYAAAHFLVLPSTADASPIVFSEAQAFGVPSVAYDVGGVSSSIRNGETGYLLPPGTPAEGFVNVINKCVADPTEYRRLSANCRDRYVREANWEKWATLIQQLARELETEQSDPHQQ